MESAIMYNPGSAVFSTHTGGKNKTKINDRIVHRLAEFQTKIEVQKLIFQHFAEFMPTVIHEKESLSLNLGNETIQNYIKD